MKRDAVRGLQATSDLASLPARLLSIFRSIPTTICRSYLSLYPVDHILPRSPLCIPLDFLSVFVRSTALCTDSAIRISHL